MQQGEDFIVDDAAETRYQLASVGKQVIRGCRALAHGASLVRSPLYGRIALVGAAVVAGVQAGGGATSLGHRLLAMGLLLAASCALWWRDRAPVLVLASTAAAAVAYYLVGGPPGPEPVPFVMALYGVARSGYRRVAIVAVPVATLAVVLADQVASGRSACGNGWPASMVS